jgi:hypothetical protein
LPDIGTEPAAIAPARDLEWWARLGLLVLLAWSTWGFVRSPFNQALMDSVWHLPDLIFHEAGHILFMPFGQFLMSLGGSLFQCVLPVALAVVFLRQDNSFGAIVCAWWAGQNLVDVAPYIADARSLSLVLIGGRTGAEVEGHDWEYILGELGWLHLDRTIGSWTYRIGVVVMLAALASAAATLLWTGRPRPPHRPRTAA